jgi:hypothetical protein
MTWRASSSWSFCSIMVVSSVLIRFMSSSCMLLYWRVMSAVMANVVCFSSCTSILHVTLLSPCPFSTLRVSSGGIHSANAKLCLGRARTNCRTSSLSDKTPRSFPSEIAAVVTMRCNAQQAAILGKFRCSTNCESSPCELDRRHGDLGKWTTSKSLRSSACRWRMSLCDCSARLTTSCRCTSSRSSASILPPR